MNHNAAPDLLPEALAYALKHDHMPVCRLLEAHGANLLEARNALECAAAKGATDTVRMLLANQSNNQWRREAAIKAALTAGHEEVAHAILSGEKSPDWMLNTVVRLGSPEMVRTLLAKGVERQSVHRAMKTAVMAGRANMVSTLLSHDSNPYSSEEEITLAINRGHIDCFHSFLAHGIGNYAASQAFIAAAKHGYTDIMTALLPHGFHFDTLYQALEKAISNEHADIVAALLSAPDLEPSRLEYAAGTAVHKGNIDIIHLFLNKTLSDSTLTGMLASAFDAQRRDIITALFNKGVKLNRKCRSIDNLRRVVSMGFSKHALFFLSQSDINQYHISNALMSAVQANQPEMVELLLRHGADPDYKPGSKKSDKNVLETATENQNIEIVKKLLDYGANPREASDSLIDLALNPDSTEIMDALLAEGVRRPQWIQGLASSIMRRGANLCFHRLLDVGQSDLFHEELSELMDLASGSIDFINTLWSLGADLGQSDVLTTAVKNGRVDSVNRLLDIGSPPARLSDALEAAAKPSWTEPELRNMMTMTLLAYGAEPKDLAKVLSSVLEGNDIEIINMFLARKTMDWCTLRDWREAFSSQLQDGYMNAETTRILLDHKIFPMFTPTLITGLISYQRLDVIRLLIDYCPDFPLQSALEIAMKQSRPHVTQLLRNYGATLNQSENTETVYFRGSKIDVCFPSDAQLSQPVTSLQTLCRSCIRQRLAEHLETRTGSLKSAINDLPLPPPLAQFLFNPLGTIGQ